MYARAGAQWRHLSTFYKGEGGGVMLTGEDPLLIDVWVGLRITNL